LPKYVKFNSLKTDFFTTVGMTLVWTLKRGVENFRQSCPISKIVTTGIRESELFSLGHAPWQVRWPRFRLGPGLPVEGGILIINGAQSSRISTFSKAFAIQQFQLEDLPELQVPQKSSN
jgi:hypothetical protein